MQTWMCSQQMWWTDLHWVTGEAARVAGLPEALLAGRDEARRDGIPDNLPRKDELLGFVLRKRLHVAHHTPILPLPTCVVMLALSCCALLRSQRRGRCPCWPPYRQELHAVLYIPLPSLSQAYNRAQAIGGEAITGLFLVQVVKLYTLGDSFQVVHSGLAHFSFYL